MLAQFGVKLARSGATVELQGGQQLRGGADRGAGRFLLGGVLPGRRLPRRARGPDVRRVGINPTRTGLLDALRLMGARISVTPAVAGRRMSRAPTSPCARARCTGR